jgi:hypothetical protein
MSGRPLGRAPNMNLEDQLSAGHALGRREQAHDAYMCMGHETPQRCCYFPWSPRQSHASILIEGRDSTTSNLSLENVMRDSEKPAPKHTIVFFVDNEEFTTEEHELTVAQILTMSHNEPVQNFSLLEFKGASDQQVRHDDPDERLHLHEKERFAALYRGPTPVSQSW